MDSNIGKTIKEQNNKWTIIKYDNPFIKGTMYVEHCTGREDYYKHLIIPMYCSQDIQDLHEKLIENKNIKLLSEEEVDAWILKQYKE